MSDLLWLTEVQMARLQPFFPRSHGAVRASMTVVFRAAWSSSIAMVCAGVMRLGSMVRRRCSVTAGSGGAGWGFRPDDEGWPPGAPGHKAIMIDATCPRGIDGLQPGVKRGRGRMIGRAKDGMSAKLHIVTDVEGAARLFMAADQVSDHTSAASLPAACLRQNGCRPGS